MKPPTIIVDLDNVLALSAEGFIKMGNELFGTSLTLDDYGEDWPKMWGITHEEAVRRAGVMFDHEYQTTYLAVPGALAVLKKLQINHQLVILTSRRQVSGAITRAWLDEYYPDIFPDVEFAGFWEDPNIPNGHLLTKAELYQKLGADYVIDDQLKHCVAATEVDMKAILFGDYPWNQADMLPDGLTRCDDWAAVVDYFEGAVERV